MRFEHRDEHEMRREQPLPETAGGGRAGALDLASAIGNQAMQRVAAAPALQRAAAPLVGAGGARLQRREHEVLEEQETHENLGSPEGIEGNRIPAGQTKEPAGPLDESHGREAGVEVDHPAEEIGRFAGVEQEVETTRAEEERPKKPGEPEEVGVFAGVGDVEIYTSGERD